MSRGGLRSGGGDAYDLKMQKRRDHNCLEFSVATAVLGALVAVAAIIMAGFAIGYAQRDAKLQTYVASSAIVNSPFQHALDATAAPLAMVLPNDLSDYVGKTYQIYSRSNQPHTVTIAAGSLTTTYDGVNTIATFGGAIGDGFTMFVLDKNRVVILHSVNIAFS